ncbi:MAG: polyprenol monophosphomannose synthase [Ilumatobacter sp.]|nr:polyprenol monophosphomannose synthase [Ilumatobacter sp.]
MRSVIVLPTYNERENIEAFLRSVRAVDPDVDVLVVDDASPDGTADAARSVADELGNVSVLDRTAKDGLGSAYRAGFERVLGDGYDVVISMDADHSHDPAVIPSMLALIDDGADAVIGSRYVPGGGTADWPVHRRLLSRWGNAYTRIALRLPARDCTSGYRAYRADALRAIDPTSTEAEGYAFLTELVRRLDRAGFTIEETPIVFRDRELGKSKMSGRIIVESMWLVTTWAAGDLLRRRDRS